MCNKKPFRPRSRLAGRSSSAFVARARAGNQGNQGNESSRSVRSGPSSVSPSVDGHHPGGSRVGSMHNKKKHRRGVDARQSRDDSTRRLPPSRPSLRNARVTERARARSLRLYTTDQLSRGTPYAKTRFTTRRVRFASWHPTRPDPERVRPICMRKQYVW